MAKTAINLYSVRDLDEPLLEILERVAAAGYDGVQFSGGLRGTDPAEVRATLEETGLETTPAHIGIDVLEEELESAYGRFGETLDCGGVVVPYLEAEAFATPAAVDATADRLAELAEATAALGWPLHYHNHDHEFVSLGEEAALERLLARVPELRLELDVGWALVGGSDPAALIERYGERIEVLHTKDMVTDEPRGFREIGEGDVDMEACAYAAHEADVEWLVYEHDEPDEPAASIETGAAYLDSL
ncbi:sugar phosphate isomerase/epimerase family protein [Natronobiforma cellulositropha]|uniref:sugar phosphate isomerase/epimerase family protein n=1 Tax=Natronobiforma cellulositropha TaxID=1679076 RepID=UPI0021D59845|nr:sugar phosphate isomerase/epimerase [Natronobiforma cellulositropha]